VLGINSIDLIGCGGGGGGGGNNDAWSGNHGVNGGGGGGGISFQGIRSGGFPGGGAGGPGGYPGGGGGGFAIKTITGLTPGTSIAVTVGSGNMSGAGLVIVEY
jgi:hypothetical protein